MRFMNRDLVNFGRPYVIAELGANHNGDLNLARRLIDAAKRAGADCVKFQSWTKDTIFSIGVYESNHFLKDDYRDRQDFSLEAIVEKFQVTESQLLEMRDYCRQVGIDFSSTPFCERETNYLVDQLDAGFIKVASMDCNNYPLLDHLARKGRPVMLSTGLSTMSEITQAVDTIEQAGNRDIILLHCVAIYPPADEILHLRNIDMLRDNFPQYPVGFSDHTLGTIMPIAAIAKGACVIEKHFTLDKSMFGWDHKVSATEDELRVIVEAAQRVPVAQGSYRRVLSAADYEKIPAFRRSIVAAKSLKAGHILTRADLDLKRPGTGLAPKWMPLVVGRTLKRDLGYDQILAPEDF